METQNTIDAASATNETTTSSINETEGIDSNLEQAIKVYLEEDSETTRESVETPSDQATEPSDDKKEPEQSFEDYARLHTPSPTKIFNAFDTTGAAMVCKILAEDMGEALGNTELFKEVDLFIKKIAAES